MTATGLVPDNDHYKGSFAGRVFPLWLDRACTTPNIRPRLLAVLRRTYGLPVSPEDVMAYIAAVMAHPDFTARFQGDLVKPGLRVPVTANAALFKDAVTLGRTVLWLHTFGERFTDASASRPAQPPRLPRESAPRIPTGGGIGTGEMPDKLVYADSENRLYVGQGYIDGVTRGMWRYAVSGKQVILHWFSYRKANRERPIIGERRQPSPLSDVQPDRWPAEYTTELLNLLNVLGRLVELEPLQADLLQRICASTLLSVADLRTADAFNVEGYPVQPTAISRSAVAAQVSFPWEGGDVSTSATKKTKPTGNGKRRAANPRSRPRR